MFDALLMHPRCFRWITAIAISALSACKSGEPHSPAPPAPRAVLVYEITDVAAQWQKEYPATLRSARKTILGFEAGGRLAAVHVKEGDRINIGQVLAELDNETLRLQLQRAQAARDMAATVLADRRRRTAIQDELRREGLTSEPSVAEAQNDLKGAEAQFKETESEVALATTHLRRARMNAPFDGNVVRRLADPHTELQPGQGVIELEGNTGLEIEALLPEAEAVRLRPGQRVHVSASSSAERVEAVIRQIGTRVEMGSLVAVVARLKNAPLGLRTGQIMRLHIEADPKMAQGVLVPINAILPGSKADEGAVFVFDPVLGRVARRSVQLHPALIEGERVTVTRGLKPGERIVATGATFLQDGQAATAWRPDGRDAE